MDSYSGCNSWWRPTAPMPTTCDPSRFEFPELQQRGCGSASMGSGTHASGSSSSSPEFTSSPWRFYSPPCHCRGLRTHTCIYIVYIYVHICASISRFSVHLSNSLHQSFYLVTSLVLSYLIWSCLIYLCARARLHVCLHPRNILNLYSVCELYDHHPLLEEDVSKCQIHYIHAYTETYIYM